MMQFSDRISAVSGSVLLCLSTFELQSGSSANFFHVSGSFCTVDFGVM